MSTRSHCTYMGELVFTVPAASIPYAITTLEGTVPVAAIPYAITALEGTVPVAAIPYAIPVPEVVVSWLTEDEKNACRAAIADLAYFDSHSHTGFDTVVDRVRALAMSTQYHPAFLGEIGACKVTLDCLAARSGWGGVQSPPYSVMILIAALARNNEGNKVKLGAACTEIVRLMRVWSTDKTFIAYGCVTMMVLFKEGGEINRLRLIDAGAREVLEELVTRPEHLLELPNGVLRDRAAQLLAALNGAAS